MHNLISLRSNIVLILCLLCDSDYKLEKMLIKNNFQKKVFEILNFCFYYTCMFVPILCLF